MAAGKHAHPAVARGVDYLLSQQQADGTWHETEYTGTGFPCVFYLRYHYYPIYFPLLALAEWARWGSVTVEAASCRFKNAAGCRIYFAPVAAL